jgi:hypothetical protein
MGKFTTVKCWYVGGAVTDLAIVKQAPPSFSILKKSILKNGYRGFVIDDREVLESQEWYSAFLLSEEVRFYIDGSGVYRLANCDLIENELYFERLNVPIGFRPWIFYSWQSDHNPSRSKIKDALNAAVNHVNEHLLPKIPLEIVESTREQDGAGNIVDSIKSNIDRCMFAVFDITNVSKVLSDDANSKHYPNANVVFELSYALVQKKADQVLLLKQKRTKDLPNDAIPFDFEQNKRIDFDAPASLRREVQSILISHLRRRNFIESEE